MALSVLPVARQPWTANRVQCHAACESVCDIFGVGAGNIRPCLRPPAQVPKTCSVPWAHKVQQLLHDYNFSRANTLPALELGSACEHASFCDSRLAPAALWADAVSEIMHP